MAKDALVKINKNMELPEAEGTHYRLLCMTGKNKGISYYLKGQRIVMGRGGSSNVQVYDEKASREHAELKYVGGSYIVTDLGSQNGVTINDLKVTQYSLKDNDKIIIGKTVYKFSKILVKGDLALAESDLEKFENESDDEENENKKPDRRKLIYGFAILAVIYVFLSPDQFMNDEGEPDKDKVEVGVSSVDSRLADIFKNTARPETNENKKKLQTILERGLREYRERNYFRALDEFELALILSPNNGIASFYKNRTLQRIDEDIRKNFIKARQDEGALKFSSAKISYCAIVRLLIENQEDERFIRAEKSVRELERKMGVSEGDLKCIER